MIVQPEGALRLAFSDGLRDGLQKEKRSLWNIFIALFWVFPPNCKAFKLV
jgi:hypothetical protein